MASISLTFPDSTYTSDNKPSVDTLKSDLSAIETAVNANAGTMTENTDTNVKANSWVLDEDAMGSDSDQKVATQQSIKAYIDAQITATKAALYPVGCIYTNITGTNPNTELGFGTWVAFGVGRMMVGYDAGDGDFDEQEETGGAKTHTLTTDEMPSHTHVQDAHNHTATYITDGENDPLGGDRNFCTDDRSNTGVGTKMTIANKIATNQNTGGGSAHSILNKYITVSFWKRTV